MHGAQERRAADRIERYREIDAGEEKQRGEPGMRLARQAGKQRRDRRCDEGQDHDRAHADAAAEPAPDDGEDQQRVAGETMRPPASFPCPVATMRIGP